MLVSKNMLIPEIKVQDKQEWTGLSFNELEAALDKLDNSTICYVVQAVTRQGRDMWTIRQGKVA